MLPSKCADVKCLVGEMCARWDKEHLFEGFRIRPAWQCHDYPCPHFQPKENTDATDLQPTC